MRMACGESLGVPPGVVVTAVLSSPESRKQ